MKNLKIEAIIVSLGLIILGSLVYLGLQKFAERDRSVWVKGFNERIVKADNATWPIRYKKMDNSLENLYANQADAKKKIMSFLTTNGISETDINVSAPKVTDYETVEYKPENIKSRYSIEMTITVSSNKVDLVHDLTYRTNELIREGVSLRNNDYEESITYSFNGLDKLKPEMIEASTKNAREAAEKFAKDSGSKLGKIRQATQGYFSIDNRDEFTPWMKKVRVVTSVSYYLKN